jgi:hypothetical protein
VVILGVRGLSPSEDAARPVMAARSVGGLLCGRVASRAAWGEGQGGLEGKTEKLKNPYAKEDLAWAAWIIGRLEGWKVYNAKRPPGVITPHEGWVRFHNIFTGWLVAKRCV